MGQVKQLLGHLQETLRIPQQVVGLPGRDRMGQAGLGGSAFAGAGGEEGCPLGQLWCHPGEQHPGVPLAAGMRTGANGKNCRSRPQRRDMGRRIAHRVLTGDRCFSQ